eukprot:403341726
MDKLKTFFQSTEKDKVKGGSKEEVKGKTVNDQYQEMKKKWLIGEKQQDKKVQEPAKEETAEDLSDPKKIQDDKDKIAKIAQLIDSNINRKYFSEKKLSNFFEICYQIKNPQLLRDDQKFQKFLNKDLKFIIQSLKSVENFYNFVKFIVYFKIDQDPELMELLADQIKTNIGKFKNDEILEILVNFSHTLSPETQSVCEVANEDFVYRLSENFNPEENELYIQHEDFPKILNTFVDLRMLSAQLKEAIIEYLKENINQFNYAILSELAVVFSNKIDKTYKMMFFELFKEKFMKDLGFLDQETLYKILWSLTKADVIEVSEKGYEWMLIKDAIIKKSKDMSPDVLTNLMVLSTVANKDGLSVSSDLFETLQPQIIVKMQTMNLSDLINLLWSAQEIDRGSEYFYQNLEKEITSRIRNINDDDLILLIECFSETQTNFSNRFLDIILKVVTEKKDKFQIKTLVGLIFTFAKIDFSNNRIMEVLQQFKEYERLKVSLPKMLQKSQCILLWTYSRDERLFDKEFLQLICQSILNFEGPKFELDNFDILLICQAIMHIQRSELGQDHTYMSQFFQLTSMVETFTQKNLPKMNIHEFTTVLLFYLQHDHALSKSLLQQFLLKLSDSVGEFNELQLNMFQKALIKCGVKNSERFERSMFQETLEKIQEELEGIQIEKEYLESEDRIIEVIQQRIMDKANNEAKPFKSTYTQAESKLDKEISKSKAPAEKSTTQPDYAQPSFEDVKQKLFNQTDDQQPIEEDKSKQLDEKQQELEDKEVEQKLMKYLKNRSRK